MKRVMVSGGAGIKTKIGDHTLQTTRITAYLKNSGKLKIAQHIVNHESRQTTKFYDQRQDEISLYGNEWIANCPTQAPHGAAYRVSSLSHQHRM